MAAPASCPYLHIWRFWRFHPLFPADPRTFQYPATLQASEIFPNSNERRMTSTHHVPTNGTRQTSHPQIRHDFEGFYECRLSNIRGGAILRTVPSFGIYVFARDPPPLQLKVRQRVETGRGVSAQVPFFRAVHAPRKIGRAILYIRGVFDRRSGISWFRRNSCSFHKNSILYCISMPRSRPCTCRRTSCGGATGPSTPGLSGGSRTARSVR